MRTIFAFFALSLLFLACSKDDGADQPQSQTPTEGVNIYTNAADPLILESFDDDGNRIQFYGIRDANGRPLKFDKLNVLSNGKQQTYIYDDNGRPSMLLADNGTQLELEWLDNTRFALTIYTPDGLNQVNTVVDLNDPGNITSPTSKTNTRKDRKLRLSYSPVIQQPMGSRSSGNNTSVQLNISECGERADAAGAYIVVQDEDGAFLRSISPKRTANGEYTASIPNDLAPSINGQDVCEDVAGFINDACDLPMLPENFFATMCLSISTALASTGIGATIAGQVLVACEALVLGYEISCGIYGTLDTTGIIDRICNANFINQTWTEDLRFIGGVTALPNNIITAPVTAPGQGPYPTLELSIGDDTAIKSFFLSPSAPASGQDYNAIARLSCLRPGMSVELSVVGTDGYTDSITYPITAPDGLGEFTLNVPGAEAGIQDTITINIYLELGGVITRTASLVFGG